MTETTQEPQGAIDAAMKAVGSAAFRAGIRYNELILHRMEVIVGEVIYRSRIENMGPTAMNELETSRTEFKGEYALARSMEENYSSEHNSDTLLKNFDKAHGDLCDSIVGFKTYAEVFGNQRGKK